VSEEPSKFELGDFGYHVGSRLIILKESVVRIMYFNCKPSMY